MLFSIGGLDILTASREVFPLCWHLGLSEQLRDEEEDARSAAWMVQEGRTTCYPGQVPTEFFGRSLVELEVAVRLPLWCWEHLQLLSNLQAPRNFWTIEQTFQLHRSLCSLVGPGRQGSESILPTAFTAVRPP